MTDHLQPSVREVLEQPIEKQVQFVRSPGWIGYDSANEIMAKLNELLDWPQCHRMPNLLVVGETNNGKSMLLTRFCEEHRPYYKDPEKFEGFTLPALFVQCPPIPDERMLYITQSWRMSGHLITLMTRQPSCSVLYCGH